MERTCENCGGSLDPERPKARFCKRADCVRERARLRKRKSKGAEVVPFRPVEPERADDLVAATVRKLEEAGRLDSHEGQGALYIARRLVGSTRDNGSAIASLHREYREAMTVALAGAETEADAVAERVSRIGERRLSVVS